MSIFTSNVFAERERLIASYDVSNGFEKEVRLDSYTTLDWTLENGDGIYELIIDLPGKQLPASGWKDFYEEKGWDTAQTNEFPLEFSDGSTGTLYVDVIGNSGKVRFLIEVNEQVSENESQDESEQVYESDSKDESEQDPIDSEKDKDIEKEKKTDRDKDVSEKESYEDKICEKDINLILVENDSENSQKNLDVQMEASKSGTWYIWINQADEPIITEENTVTFEGLSPGTHHIKVELRDDTGNIVCEYEEIFTVSTVDGGILPETATHWPNLLLSALLLMGLGIFVRTIIAPSHLNRYE